MEEKIKNIIYDYIKKAEIIFKEYVNDVTNALEAIDENFSIDDIEIKLTSSNEKMKEAFKDVTSEILSNLDENHLIFLKKKNISQKA